MGNYSLVFGEVKLELKANELPVGVEALDVGAPNKSSPSRS